MARLKKGVHVRVLVGNDPDVELVGTIVKNQAHLPNPFQVDVDLEASKGLDADAKAFFTANYAGPYKAHELEVL